MAAPVKISDRLLAFAREEARGSHRSATAQIEHWATLGRAVEVLLAYTQILALKKAGQSLPIPKFVRREDVHDVLARLVDDADREAVKSRIRAAGTPVYTAEADHSGSIVEVQADGTRTHGRLKRRRFVPDRGKSAARRK